MTPDTQRLAYTAAEVAERLGVHSRTVYRAIASGELPHVKVAGRKLVPVAALERFLAKAVA